MIMLALVIAVVGVYALVRYIRTDHSKGSVEVVVGSQLMAYISPEDALVSISVSDALEAVAVRPTSMQTVVLSGPDFSDELAPDELETLYLIAGEKHIALADASGEALGTIERIYLPIDE